MNQNEEAFFLATGCLFLGLIRRLSSTNRLSTDDMAEVAGLAEETLALISPSIMSEAARDKAYQHIHTLLTSALRPPG